MSLVVDRYELGPIQTNCYVVRFERGAPQAAVVDPGADASTLRLELARMATACAGILVTHGHFDHVGAVAKLAEGLDVRVWMPEEDAPMLERYEDFAPVGTGGRAYTPDVELARNPFLAELRA